MRSWLRHFPEIWFTAALAGLCAALSIALDLPFNLPSGERAAFVGVHYLYPLIGLCIWVVVAEVGQRRRLASTFLVALPCYAMVLICHFNLKLWSPHINPRLWDGFFWSTDEMLRPLVEGSTAISRALAPVVPLDGNFYMIGFVGLFYVSFCYHAVKTPERFHALFLAALLLQGLGALAYLAMPAVGPFVYEAGVYQLPSSAQQSMHAAWQANAAGGADWLRTYGSSHLTVGLAAMPSLHAGGSFLFLLFAWRYAPRALAVPYALVFAYICIAAVSSRWHYVVDIPAGMALALFCYWAGHRLSAMRGVGRSGVRAAPAESPLPSGGTAGPALAPIA